MKVVMTIPTYWGRSRCEPLDLEDVVYDHPTPVDEEGTLRRALESFRILKNKDFEIIVLAAATNQAFEKLAQEKVKSIVRDFKNEYRIALLSYSDISFMKNNLRGKVADDALELINLYGYPNIRNMCLMAAHLRDAEAVILFDDDEIIKDPHYLDKATEFVGKTYQGEFVGGVAGWYERPEGGYLAPLTGDWWWMEWQGSEAMNEAFSLISEPPRLKQTPFAFGGNTVIHKEVFIKIPFDPMITRGEDIDHLVNAKMFGYQFFLDRELWIKHLPPPGRVPDWLGFRQNVIRFVYMRAKLKSQHEVDGMKMVRAEDLKPCPGRFLGDDLKEKVYKTSILLGVKHLLEGNDEDFCESLKNIEIARTIGESKDSFDRYLKLQRVWEELMSKLTWDEDLKAYLREKIET